ncbi:hypothetical protein HPB49_010194 [Dermacentor silvarum]|uniref:Uncharacterized protein n=1 Tax=Dermacentor silvarum TaxID=543639 RepID=A0ACB8DZD0_DERSI|nr:hypothetical protein HPB49_010194 [Dermacentor silvarum]
MRGTEITGFEATAAQGPPNSNRWSLRVKPDVFGPQKEKGESRTNSKARERVPEHGPPLYPDNVYEALKATLIRRITPSESQWLQQLLHETNLGDRTPSQLLRQMQLLGSKVDVLDSLLLQEIFLQKIPPNARMVMTASNENDLSKLAELADKLMVVAPTSVAAVTSEPSPHEQLQEMKNEISRLVYSVTAEIAEHPDWLTVAHTASRCGSSSSKIAAENHRFSNSGSESIPQPPPHQSQTSGSCISTSASTAFHSVLGSTASKTADEAASAAAAEADACGDDAGNQQYGDPWDTDQAAVALRLLRAEDNRKSPSPAHATPAAKGAPSTNEVARQPVYEAAFDLRRKKREPDQGLDRMVQSPVPLIPGLQQQPLAGPLHPVPSLCSSSEVSLVRGHRGGITGQPSPRDACCPGPTPHQGSSGGIAVSSSVQLQPTPTHRGFSGSDGGRPSVPIPATGYQGLAFKQASAADKTICQNDPLPRSSISENTPAAPIGAIAVKRNIHAGVKVRHSESVRRLMHGGHRNKAEPMALTPVLLNMFRWLALKMRAAMSTREQRVRTFSKRRARRLDEPRTDASSWECLMVGLPHCGCHVLLHRTANREGPSLQFEGETAVRDVDDGSNTKSRRLHSFCKVAQMHSTNT